MYNSILVPIALDHSGRTAPAIKAAKAMLNQGGSITLLHVLEQIPSYASTVIPETVFQENQKEAETNLSLAAKDVGPGTQTAVVWGHAAATILAYAKDHDMDCIVIASHRPGIEDYFLGSTAARVVRHATCNVHVMR